MPSQLVIRAVQNQDNALARVTLHTPTQTNFLQLSWLHWENKTEQSVITSISESLILFTFYLKYFNYIFLSGLLVDLQDTLVGDHDHLMIMIALVFLPQVASLTLSPDKTFPIICGVWTI